jgi:[protein-PII] uridylyltransferase
MGFAPDDVAILVGLVRNHLLLADAATRRDLDDPATIEGVARAVHDQIQLELLAALTEADSVATGSAAWGQWKAGLVADLVRRVAVYLADGQVQGPTPLITDRHRGFMTQVQRLGRSVVAADAPNVTVVTRDRPGLLSAVTGVFALRGLDVRSADIASEDGFAVEAFVVDPSRGRWPDFKLVADQLDAVLRGTFPLEERLAEQVRAYATGRRSVSSRPVELRVDLDNDASSGSTVLDVRAQDDVGLLHRITAALFALELDVVAARVSTLGHEVLDAFYVRDATTGGKVTDPEHMQRIRDRVMGVINASPTDEVGALHAEQ